ncbi:MAG TPA: hypothetical protein VNL92_03605, partial [Dehalococcoidia bacterium]|nr:hypothetical protein [Dehalococcoidia bacterium]
AFARAHDEGWALAIVPRLVMRWARFGKSPMGRRVWADSVIRLPADAPTRWANALTAETVLATQRGPELVIDAADALRRLPVALLIA